MPGRDEDGELVVFGFEARWERSPANAAVRPAQLAAQWGAALGPYLL